MLRPVSILTLLLTFLVSGCANMPGHIPTPVHAMKFSIADSSREWVAQNFEQYPDQFLMEFVPEGDDVRRWTEMFSSQVVFTSETIEDYVAGWTQRLRQADPDIELHISSADNNEKVVLYRSDIAREVGLRKFVKGEDGVYMIAYHVRPEIADPETIAQWREAFENAELFDNPVRSRR